MRFIQELQQIDQMRNNSNNNNNANPNPNPNPNNICKFDLFLKHFGYHLFIGDGNSLDKSDLEFISTFILVAQLTHG